MPENMGKARINFASKTVYEWDATPERAVLSVSELLAQTKGPRLGHLLASLDRDFVVGRVRHFSG